MLLLLALVAGSGSAWAETGDILSENFEAKLSGWTTGGKSGSRNSGTGVGGSYSYQFGGANSTNVGSLETPALASMTSSGKATLEFYAKGSSAIVLKISSTNCKIDGGTTKDITVSTSEFVKYTIDITEGNASSKIKFEKKSEVKGAIHLDNVVITSVSGDPIAVTGVNLDQAELELEVGETETLSPTVTPVGATNKTVNWESDDESVATVSSSGLVTAVGVGTTNITVTTADGDFEDYCTVTVRTPAIPSITFDFTDPGWGFPSDSYEKAETSYTNNGYTIVLGATSSDGHKVLTSGSGASLKYLALIFGKNGAKITFPEFPFNVHRIKVYGKSDAAAGVKFNIFVGDNPVSTEATGSNKDHKFNIASDKQDAGTEYVLKLTTTDKNAQITKIEVFGYENVDVSSAGYATYASGNALDYSDVTGLKAYKATVEGTAIAFTKVGSVPAGEGVLLQGAEATYKVPVVSGVSSWADADNAFVCGTGAAVETGNGPYNYILNKVNNVVGFYKANGQTVNTNRAYLQSATSAARIAINFEEAQGIATVQCKDFSPSNSVYTLDGRRVSDFDKQNSLRKGLYIVNGKKVVVK